MRELNLPTNRDWTTPYKQDLAEKTISETSTLQEIARYLYVDPEEPDPHQLLMLAIEKVNKAVLNSLIHNLNFNIDINQRDAKGRTALTQAVKAGNREIVEYLLEIEGIDVNAPGEDGDYPITWAIRNNNDWVRSGLVFGRPCKPPLISLLLEKEELNVERIESDGQSPFLLALNCEYFLRLEDFLKDLLDSAKFNPNILDGNLRSPPSLAAEKSASTVVTALLKSPKVEACSQDKDGRTPLVWSILGNRVENMELLLKRDDSGVNTPDIEGRTPLSYASEKCNLGMVKALLHKCGENADQPDRDGRTPLSWAFQREPAIDPIFVPKKPASWAPQTTSRGFGTTPKSQNEEIVEYLINTGHADPHFKDNNKRTPFSWAVTTNNLDTVKYLVQHPEVDVNDPDKDRRTPLSWSAEQGYIRVVEYLLSIDDIDVNIEDNKNQSPIFWATQTKNVRMIKLFREKDVKALHTMVTKRDDVEKVKLLLEAGYDASRVDANGRTPLHRAVATGNLESAKLLIHKCPQSVNEKDEDDQTPLQLPVKFSRHMLQLLVESSAVTDEIEQHTWFNGNDGDLHDIVCLSHIGNNQYLQFMSTDRFSAEFPQHRRLIEPGMRLFISKDSPPLWASTSHFGFNGFNPDTNDARLHVKVQSYGPPQNGSAEILVGMATSFPGLLLQCLGSPKSSVMEQVISGVAIQRLRSTNNSEDGPGSFFSTLPKSIIPRDVVDFILQFIDTLEKRWDQLLKAVEDYPRSFQGFDHDHSPHDVSESDPLTDSQWSEIIAKELRNQLTDTERIDKLLKGFKKLNQIRRILKSHVESAQTVLDDYYKHKVKGKGHEQVLNAIMRLERQGNLVIDRSEQSLRDLLNFVYVRVSIDEARRSTDIARSMRHLSWMTFMFLPIMCASGLFGMNVNILKDDPDWRWFALTAGVLVSMTMGIWFFLSRNLDDEKVLRHRPGRL
ncbi:ankyrin repeat-containing domain protein [Fusarium redolens]|uniref:Ankyrin repeat-containing domain protein n=1 Tax=Fusarium redolens TaxID=48865 RepID=A0A9P9FXF8_FUSRE|nr:ankyrin repeat-containing domain protein [Fusarium redolens]KAH7207877.1 ankyrin repeat-containing domain protein [Fusarium redolens]